MSIPYTYLIGWSKYNTYYYGVRYSASCNPDELWKTYFTSSKYVKHFFAEHGAPDIIDVRKTFTDSQSARMWEHKVLRRIKAVYRLDFLNKTDNISISRELAAHFGKENGMYGKKHSVQTLEKMRGSKTEAHKEKLRGPRPTVNQTGKNNNNFSGWYVTPWGKFDSISAASNSAPFNIPQSTLIGLCKTNKPAKQKNKYNIPVGKTPTEIGYSFIMKEIA